MYFFKITFKNSLVYRWSVLFSIIGSVIYIAINLLLWRYLYHDTSEMVSYISGYTIISSIIAMFYSNGISGRIGNKVANGDFVMDLVRPINIFFVSWQMEFAEICSTFLLRGIPVILIYSPYLIVDAKYYNVPFTIIAILLGHILFMLIYSLLGFSTFILIETWAFRRLVDDTIRLLAGGFIPLTVLPDFLGRVAYILPFRFLYSFPLELLLGTFDMNIIIENFFICTIWIFIFIGLNILMYRLALRKAVVQGG